MPNRVSNRVKNIRGTYRADRDKALDVIPEAGAPDKPSHLTPAASAVWDDIMLDLEKRRVVTRADQYSLVLVCEAYSEYLQAREVLAEKGLTYETTNAQGNVMVRKRPETSLAADSWRRAKVGLANFGLDPASRGRVESVPQPYANEFDDI